MCKSEWFFLAGGRCYLSRFQILTHQRQLTFTKYKYDCNIRNVSAQKPKTVRELRNHFLETWLFLVRLFFISVDSQTNLSCKWWVIRIHDLILFYFINEFCFDYSLVCIVFSRRYLVFGSTLIAIFGLKIDLATVNQLC